jgi:hypothetical protein
VPDSFAQACPDCFCQAPQGLWGSRTCDACAEGRLQPVAIALAVRWRCWLRKHATHFVPFLHLAQSAMSAYMEEAFCLLTSAKETSASARCAHRATGCPRLEVRCL